MRVSLSLSGVSWVSQCCSSKGLKRLFHVLFAYYGRFLSSYLPNAANRLQFNANRASRLKMFISGNPVVFSFF